MCFFVGSSGGLCVGLLRGFVAPYLLHNRVWEALINLCLHSQSCSLPGRLHHTTALIKIIEKCHVSRYTASPSGSLHLPLSFSLSLSIPLTFLYFYLSLPHPLSLLSLSLYLFSLSFSIPLPLSLLSLPPSLCLSLPCSPFLS